MVLCRTKRYFIRIKLKLLISAAICNWRCVVWFVLMVVVVAVDATEIRALVIKLGKVINPDPSIHAGRQTGTGSDGGGVMPLPYK